MSDVLWPNGAHSRPAITSGFGPRKAPVAGASTYHRGTDYVGYVLVRAISAGQVKAVGTPAGWSGGGTQVWVQHDGYLTRSMHLSATHVRVGQFVRAGDPLGVMGRTGNVSGVHHHLEVVVNGVQVDSVPFISARVGGTPAGGGSTEPAPISPPIFQEDDMATLVTGGGQNLIIGNKLIPLNGPAQVQSIKGAQVLEVSADVHYNIIQAFARDAANSALPVLVYVNGGNGTVYMLSDGKLEALVDPTTLATLHAQGAASVTLSQAEVSNLLAG